MNGDFSFEHNYEKDLIEIPPIRSKISELSQEELQAHLERECTCPHCKRKIKRKDAVIAKDYNKELIDYHLIAIPLPEVLDKNKQRNSERNRNRYETKYS